MGSLAARLSFRHLSVPTRLYVHRRGYKEILRSSVDTAKEYFEIAFDEYTNSMTKPPLFDFMIGEIWGDTSRSEPVAHLFGYAGIKPWPSDPTVIAITVRNGHLIKEQPFGTARSFIILGDEEKHRLSTFSLDEYMRTLPKNQDLAPERELTCNESGLLVPATLE